MIARVKALIVDAIKANGQREITGDILQDVLLEMLTSLVEAINESNVDLLDDIKAKFLSKIEPDTAQGLIKFLQGLEIGGFQSGMLTGKGGKIDKDGVAELESLTLRSFLEAPEFRKNRVTLIGDKFVVGSGGIIEEVLPTGTDGNFNIKLKLEDGDINPFDVEDIIEGIYHHETSFGTTWIGVNSLDGEWMNVFMRPNTASQTFFPPVPMMHIAHRGNFSNTERQSSIILSGREGKIVMYDNVNNWDAGRVASHWGKKQGLEFLENFENLPIGKNDAVQYLHTLLYQNLIKVDYKGDVIKEYRDRGYWSLNIAQSDPYIFSDKIEDEVWYEAEKFRVKTNGTTEKPTRTSPDWTLILSIKDDIENRRGSKTFFAKPTEYKKGDRWILTEDTQLLNNFYKKGQILEATYTTNSDSDWRLMLIEGDEESTEGINLIRNYTFKEGAKHWGSIEGSIVGMDDEIPTDYYTPSINVLGDEYGYEYAITSENDELIILDE